MSALLDEAKAILALQGLKTNMLYKEQQLERAQVLATLAVAEALQGLGQPAKVEEASVPVYALTRRLPDWDRSEVNSLYLDKDAAIEECSKLNKMAQIQGVDVRWGVSPFVAKGN